MVAVVLGEISNKSFRMLCKTLHCLVLGRCHQLYFIFTVFISSSYSKCAELAVTLLVRILFFISVYKINVQ